jgi:hypothetical protein
MVSTRTLLLCGAIAGPLYVVVGFGQALLREGFDLRRHALSLLSNGDLGWIQIANFLISGALVIACAVGMRRVLHSRPAGTWGPRLIGVYGGALVAAGVFVADPAQGFPPGAPAGVPAAWSWHSTLHFVSALVGFLALIAACAVFARGFARRGERGWAAYSALTGVIFFASFAALASSGGNEALNVAFAGAVVLAWVWVTLLAMRVRRDASEPSAAEAENRARARGLVRTR